MSDRLSTKARLAMVLGVVVGVAAGLGVYELLTRDRTGPTTGPHTHEVYDMERYRQVDPTLVKWTEAGGFDTGLSVSRSVAVGPDDVVAVAGDNTVKVFASGGTPKASYPVERPEAVCYGPDGTLHVATQSGKVLLPETSTALNGPELTGPVWIKGMVVTADRIYLADAGNRIVHVLDRAGKKLAEYGKADPERNIPGLVVRSPALDVAMAPDGLLRVTNVGRLRVEAYTDRGDLEVSWGKASPDIDGFCGCCNPINLAVFPDGRVVTAEKGLPRVKIFEPLGAFKEVVAPPSAFDRDTDGLDVAVDSTGAVRVLDSARNRVRLFKRNAPATERPTR